MRNRILSLAVVCSFAISPLFSQSFTGAILGTIRDTTGGVIPTAAVVIVNTGTNLRTEVHSDEHGYYIAPLLQPGSYRVEVSSSGFKKYVQEGIILQVNQQARVDVALAVGEVTESVMVSADAVTLETTTSGIGKVVDNRRIVDLPLNTRNVYSLVFLTPGLAGTVGNNYGDMRYSVNGARVRTMDTLIDGVTATHATVTGGSGISVFPSVDAIEEFKVMGSNYPAEFGRSQGNVLNVIFKSGTNQIHGSAYEFLRNSVLDSNNFFDNRIGRKLSSFKRSQFGGTISGPIKSDKTFFMGAYEGLRSNNFANRVFTVPTELERRGDFTRTFAANGQQIRVFDPFSTRPNPAGGFIRDQFPNNTIPASRFDPVAVNVIKFYPQSNTVGNPVTNQNNYSRSGTARQNLDQFDVRADHNISPTQKFFARYSHRTYENDPLISFPQDLTVAEGRVIEQDRVRGAVADYTNTLSPNTILTVRLG
ncbi:MAG: carboxypeptidase regulatory-like domain-containing protein, partial [Acidimicrobiia bacterium]|nr:carboxypeptidase regulatory-like domain-containing protein [Acidimicrobiia bacterium]